MKDIDEVYDVLEDVEDSKTHLITEVVTSALNFMKNNPTLEVGEAMRLGYDEWIK